MNKITTNKKHKWQKGMTFIELMVAVVVLAIIVIIAGNIMAYANRSFISMVNMVRASAASEGLSRVLSADLEMIAKDAFLYISRPATKGEPGALADAPPWRTDKLIFVSSRASTSLFCNFKGSSAIISYGLCKNALRSSPNHEILSRQAFIVGNYSSNTDGDDIWGSASGSPPEISYSRLCSMSEADKLTFAHAVVAQVPTSLSVPPENAIQLTEMWPVISARVIDFRVEFGGIDLYAGTSDIPSSTNNPTFGKLIWKCLSIGGEKLWTTKSYSDWSSASAYTTSSSPVQHGGIIYKCISNHSGSGTIPRLAPTRWAFYDSDWPYSLQPQVLKISFEVEQDGEVFTKWNSTREYGYGLDGTGKDRQMKVSYKGKNYAYRPGSGYLAAGGVAPDQDTSNEYWRPAGLYFEIVIPYGTIPTPFSLGDGY